MSLVINAQPIRGEKCNKSEGSPELDGTFYLSKTYHIDSAGLCAQADGSYWVRFSALMDGAGTGMPSKSNALAWIDVGRVVTVIS